LEGKKLVNLNHRNYSPDLMYYDDAIKFSKRVYIIIASLSRRLTAKTNGLMKKGTKWSNTISELLALRS
jgi:hypothetical protein